MPTLQKKQNYHTVANPQIFSSEVSGTNQQFIPITVVAEQTPRTDNFAHITLTANSKFFIQYPGRLNRHFEAPPKIEGTKLVEYLLALTGIQYAKRLASILDELGKLNSEAIYPIMSILDPYIEPIPIIDFHVPPKSSREFTIEVTREGRTKPVQ
jgi:hypothetical protein